MIEIEGVSEGQINQIFDQAAAEAGRFASDVRLSFAESVGRVCATLSLT